MSNNFDNNRIKAHAPANAFYVPVPSGLVLDDKQDYVGTPTQQKTNDNNKDAEKEYHTLYSTTSAYFPTVTTPAFNDKNNRVIHHVIPSVAAVATVTASLSNIQQISAPTPIVKTAPPFIDSESNKPYVNAKEHQVGTGTNKMLPCWLPPLLAVLGTVLVIVIIMAIYYFCNYRRRRRIGTISRSAGEEDYPPPHNTTVQHRIKAHTSWGSISTINTSPALIHEHKSEKEKNILITTPSPTPAYYPTTRAQKRLTADTLVENGTDMVMMLKKQYSPQLAFSPSLVAGEFQQNVADVGDEQPPLPHQNPMLSPSNTLIDNMGLICSEKEGQEIVIDKLEYIKAYEPQVSDPFHPIDSFSYSNDGDEEQSLQHRDEVIDRNRYYH